jgi:hypothetical protein
LAHLFALDLALYGRPRMDRRLGVGGALLRVFLAVSI